MPKLIDQETIDRKKAIRDAIFGSAKKPASEIVKFRNIEIEVREPGVSKWIEALALSRMTMSADGSNTMSLAAMMSMRKHLMMTCCFVPGTEVLVFDDADDAVVSKWASDESAFVELGDVAMSMAQKAEAQAKNSEPTA